MMKIDDILYCHSTFNEHIKMGYFYKITNIKYNTVTVNGYTIMHKFIKMYFYNHGEYRIMRLKQLLEN